jgi:hypothetical protein
VWRGIAVLAIPTARPPGKATHVVGDGRGIRPFEQTGAQRATPHELAPVRALCRALTDPRSRRRIDGEAADARAWRSRFRKPSEGLAQEMLDLSKPYSTDLAPGRAPVVSLAGSRVVSLHQGKKYRGRICAVV